VERLKEIQRRAAARHGGAQALEALLPKAKSRNALRRTPEHRYLSGMAKAIFQAGFVWRVVEAKWDGFEEAFREFDPDAVASLSEKKLQALARDTRIIRNPQKIRAVRDNASFLLALREEHGSASRFFADWPVEDIVGLWDTLKRRGSRLGGTSGPLFLRRLGKDTPILSRDVVRALREQGVIDQKSPSSKQALRAIQDALNTWRDESGRSLCEISRILACSVDD
jgi:3-methyladenine DNA glycosylase Tag